MDLEQNNNGQLVLLDLSFNKFSFERRKNVTTSTAQITISVKYDKNVSDNNDVRVTIETSLKGDDDAYDLSITAVGSFKIDFPNANEEFIESIMKKNTVAIMFPYIRSQITLLTSQPGFKPIVLQPININALIESEEQKQANQ